MGKSLLTSKTFWINFVQGAAALVALVQGSDLIAQYPEAVAILGLVAGGLNIVVRLITSEPITSLK